MVPKTCSKCAELVQCRSQIVYPAIPYNGLLIIGEAPGKQEDIFGDGFLGRAGKNLDALLALYNIDRSHYGRANICWCRPPNNRKPHPHEIANCLPFLAEFIQQTKPKVIITLGATPTAVFFGNKGSLLSKIMLSRKINGTLASNYINSCYPQLRHALNDINYVIPAPHTSPLTYNRYAPTGEKWSTITQGQIALAVNLL